MFAPKDEITHPWTARAICRNTSISDDAQDFDPTRKVHEPVSEDFGQ